MSSILFEISNGVAFLRLNRPEKFNAFTREMILLLQERLDDCNTNKTIRCVYLTGAGKAFSAGQDLSEITGKDAPSMTNILTDYYNPLVKRIRNMEKPVVCAVNGVAAGAGANIALCCDLVMAAQSASFIQAFSKIGLIPDSGGTFILPRLVGFQKASALMMMGDKITATEAERLGMLYKVFPDEVFGEETRKVAEILAAMPTRGLAYTKQALNASFNHSWDQQLQTEDRLQSAATETYDYREGVSAFLEKRPPSFRGE